MHLREQRTRYETLAEALEGYTVRDLKKLAGLVKTRTPSRRDDLIRTIVGFFAGDGARALWESLDLLQRAAVAEVVHDGPAFDEIRFEARYGRLPDFGSFRYFRDTPTCLRLFLPGPGILPDDVRRRLLEFVPVPEAPALKALPAIGPTVAVRSRRAPKEVEERPLMAREMEAAAFHDLRAVLQLVEGGGVSVTDRKREPTAGSVRAVAGVLLGGDFYRGDEEKALELDSETAERIGPIRAFAWPMLLQAGGLVQRRSQRLALSAAGRRALYNAAPERMLASLWEKWVETTLLDEFSRVHAIRGQGRRGAAGLTAVSPRREAIADALAECPCASWIEVDELFRHMRAAGHHFKVTHDPWNLYIEERQYGSLGYKDCHGWSILQGRYALAVLFEYAATLGLLDVAYQNPTGARTDFYHLWGSDGLEFLSRHDGLYAVRLTPLGAYALGQTDRYAGSATGPEDGLRVLPNLEVVASGEVSAGARLILDRFAEQVSERVWRLDEQRMLTAAAEGQPANALRAFLDGAGGTALPDAVARFLDDVERRSEAVVDQGSVRLFECESAELAALIAHDRRRRGLCMRAGERSLVVRVKDEKRFRTAVRALGYGVRGTP